MGPRSRPSHGLPGHGYLGEHGSWVQRHQLAGWMNRCLRHVYVSLLRNKTGAQDFTSFAMGILTSSKMAISCQFSKRPILNHGLMGGSSMNGCGGLHFSAGLYRCGGPDLRR